ncbi:hypothetical protein C7N83_07330 [Neisseria iguanae]|uniref:Uncharacterized protein n=1 Tax=Neisseria iguanae TaxID=90242 RepID=A0A2P7TZX2_9NEIS|nr:hypothetical protein C7N83_07330 [Neisseria iguanae]
MDTHKNTRLEPCSNAKPVWHTYTQDKITVITSPAARQSPVSRVTVPLRPHGCNSRTAKQVATTVQTSQVWHETFG